jgi:phosphoribosylaminoimidazole (AIR) synthetase
MGVGMMVIVAKADAASIIASANAGGVEAWLAGEITAGSGTVRLVGS